MDTRSLVRTLTGVAAPSWRSALARYGTRVDLVTRARRAPFSVLAIGQALIITPSTGRQRRITQLEFERSLPLIDRAERGMLMQATYNSSYIEAIVDDLRRTSR
jgi:hypothetical protein